MTEVLLSIFEGIPEADLARLLERLERRRYPAGVEVIQAGQRPGAMFVMESGRADILISGPDGDIHHVGRIAPGTTFGEAALITGKPAPASVRAAEDIEVLVISQDEFDRISTLYPSVFRNVARLLSDRLAATERLAAREELGRLITLRDWGAPPQLGWALACSIAWHSRAPTALVAVMAEPPGDLRALAKATVDDVLSGAHRPSERGADLIVSPPEGAFAPQSLMETAEYLCTCYDVVLLQIVDDHSPASDVAIDLADSQRPPPAEALTGRLVQAWTTSNGGSTHGTGTLVNVPAPQAQDEARMREGILPSTTPTGVALGGVARELCGLRVGLALSAGSIRGYAHFGVIRALQRMGIKPDLIAGTSIGGGVTIITGLGYWGDDGADLLDRLAETLFHPALRPTHSLLSTDALKRRIIEIAGAETRIEDLELPIAVVAADLTTGREVVVRSGLVWQAALATMSIPGIYPSQRVGEYTLVDGAIVNPLPVRVCWEMGAGAIIAVRLLGRVPPAISLAAAAAAPGPAPSALNAILHSLDIMAARIAHDRTRARTVLIELEFPPIHEKLRHFASGRAFVDRGDEATMAAQSQLAAVLPWLRA